MKKILSLLGVGLMVTTTAGMVVSCATRPIPSIASDDNVYNIGDKQLYDISKWTNDVMDGNKYKEYMLSNFTKAVINNEELNWTTFATELPDKDHTIMDQIIYEYVQGSNNGKQDLQISDIKDNVDYSLFDASESTLVKVYDSSGAASKPDPEPDPDPEEPGDGGEETRADLPKLRVKKHEKTGVYVVHFKVAVEAKESSDLFMGKRLNYVNENADANQGQINNSDMIQYYTDLGVINEGGELVDKDHASSLPIFTNDENKLTINKYDYMYDILFNFSIN